MNFDEKNKNDSLLSTDQHIELFGNRIYYFVSFFVSYGILLYKNVQISNRKIKHIFVVKPYF